MRRIAMRIGLILALIAFALPARAQYELIEIEKPFRAHNLAGVVVDSTGAPVDGVVVVECDAIFIPLHAWNSAGESVPDVLDTDCDREPKHILRSTTTDANGHFAFPKAKTGTTHYLYLRSKGFDPMKITVKSRFFAKGQLRIKLVIAT